MKPRALGFSLLEMIGVLSVMAILAGALAPSIFRMLEEAYQDAEEQSLASIADSLQDYIKRNQEIPTLANTDWPLDDNIGRPGLFLFNGIRAKQIRSGVDVRRFHSTSTIFSSAFSGTEAATSESLPCPGMTRSGAISSSG